MWWTSKALFLQLKRYAWFSCSILLNIYTCKWINGELQTRTKTQRKHLSANWQLVLLVISFSFKETFWQMWSYNYMLRNDNVLSDFFFLYIICLSESEWLVAVIEPSSGFVQSPWPVLATLPLHLEPTNWPQSEKWCLSVGALFLSSAIIKHTLALPGQWALKDVDMAKPDLCNESWWQRPGQPDRGEKWRLELDKEGQVQEVATPVRA